MAIINCRECDAAVSSTAKTCPQCGIQRPDSVQASRGMTADIIKVVLLSVVGIALVVILMIAFGY